MRIWACNISASSSQNTTHTTIFLIILFCFFLFLCSCGIYKHEKNAALVFLVYYTVYYYSSVVESLVSSHFVQSSPPSSKSASVFYIYSTPSKIDNLHRYLYLPAHHVASNVFLAIVSASNPYAPHKISLAVRNITWHYYY
ncbi:hypothetical protein BDN70DRAFT_483039 [Pholiota conissans]|uniref:Uncharacterized protein n=1 Tax=Pholiota conissans TaxID=109636 RepID=A0A9P6CSR3_9AGAR|nr:hypothetical protein BDN70DRAFT_483039 [Pholiota conissans]